MIPWALTFFIIALFAALYGFGGLTGTVAAVGQMVFFASTVLILVSVITNGFKGTGFLAGRFSGVTRCHSQADRIGSSHPSCLHGSFDVGRLLEKLKPEDVFLQ